MKYEFKGDVVFLPKDFILKKEGEWHRLYYGSNKEAIAGISSECTASEFKERVYLYIKNYRFFIQKLEPALS